MYMYVREVMIMRSVILEGPNRYWKDRIDKSIKLNINQLFLFKMIQSPQKYSRSSSSNISNNSSTSSNLIRSHLIYSFLLLLFYYISNFFTHAGDYA